MIINLNVENVDEVNLPSARDTACFFMQILLVGA
jgi:hypothetical protein